MWAVVDGPCTAQKDQMNLSQLGPPAKQSNLIAGLTLSTYLHDGLTLLSSQATVNSVIPILQLGECAKPRPGSWWSFSKGVTPLRASALYLWLQHQNRYHEARNTVFVPHEVMRSQTSDPRQDRCAQEIRRLRGLAERIVPQKR